MFDLNTFDLSIVALCGFLVGVSKTGIPGIGILVVPLLASVLPARVSVGVLLPMLIFADIFAVSYYRRVLAMLDVAGCDCHGLCPSEEVFSAERKIL